MTDFKDVADAERPDQEPLIDIKFAVKLLGVSKSTVYDMAKYGDLPHYRIGRSVKVRVSEITAWLEQKQRAGAQPSSIRKENSDESKISYRPRYRNP